ncbi:MAG: tetratricopeptide repeat protein [Verrucomicrobiaceae bacterium]|nr:MAG: tetratricopeptide repeat protein [Verrucomicrobiaceae bacterium]
MNAEANRALDQGDVEAALAIYHTITAGNASPRELLEHATLLLQLYRSGESLALFDRLLEHPATTVDQLMMAAKLWFQRGRFTDCARFSGRALEDSPDSPDIAAMHAAALERSGEKEEAREVITSILAKHPNHARSIRLLAHIERRDGNFDHAQSLLRHHLQQFPSEDDWRLRYELATVLDRLGDYTAAMRELALAKSQLEPASNTFRPQWRAMAARQWAVTRSLTKDRLKRWADSSGTMTQHLCLMAGFPRSGTTLLEQVLSAHPACIGTDESGILATQFRDPLIFGAASAEDAVAELDSFEREDLAAGRAEYLRCTADVLGEDPTGKLLIEKDPLLTPDLALPLRLFPGAKILMPLRDPRDVVISFYFTIVPGAANSVAAATLAETCQYYAEVMKHWLWLREQLDSSRWMESRYEDLIGAPEDQTRRLANFLGIDWQAGMLAHHRRSDDRAVRTPTYDDVSKPLYLRSLERWRHYEEALAPHLHHLEPYIDAFGYAR